MHQELRERLFFFSLFFSDRMELTILAMRSCSMLIRERLFFSFYFYRIELTVCAMMPCSTLIRIPFLTIPGCMIDSKTWHLQPSLGAAKSGRQEQVVFQHRLTLMKKLHMPALVSIRYAKNFSTKQSWSGWLLKRRHFYEKLFSPCVYNHRNWKWKCSVPQVRWANVEKRS